jgi:hypothetical protein
MMLAGVFTGLAGMAVAGAEIMAMTQQAPLTATVAMAANAWNLISTLTEITIYERAENSMDEVAAHFKEHRASRVSFSQVANAMGRC